MNNEYFKNVLPEYFVLEMQCSYMSIKTNTVKFFCYIFIIIPKGGRAFMRKNKFLILKIKKINIKILPDS